MCKKYKNCTTDNAIFNENCTIDRAILSKSPKNPPNIPNKPHLFQTPSKLPKVKINKDWENFLAIVKFTLFKINCCMINGC